MKFPVLMLPHKTPLLARFSKLTHISPFIFRHPNPQLRNRVLGAERWRVLAVGLCTQDGAHQ